MVGSVAEKNDEGRDLSIALSYYDTTEWDKHYKETIKDIEGKLSLIHIWNMLPSVRNLPFMIRE